LGIELDKMDKKIVQEPLYFSVALNVCENWDAWSMVESTNNKKIGMAVGGILGSKG
jgi:hypothetical protein